MREGKTKLVLLCGLLCDRRIWQPIADRLQDIADIEIFSFAGFDSIQAMARHVINNVEGNFALAGHSMGGRVAVEVFNQAPQRVLKLALLNTGVHPKRESEIPSRQRLLEMSVQKGMKAVCDAWLPPMMGKQARQNEALMADLYEMVTRHTPEEFNGEIQALLNRPEAENVLRAVMVDTLLLSSTEDEWSPIVQHREMQIYVPHSTLVGIENAGHMSTVEAPDEIAHAMRDWLTR
jgi:pimeloyl-ACP methyl ester carboxylesterase